MNVRFDETNYQVYRSNADWFDEADNAPANILRVTETNVPGGISVAQSASPKSASPKTTAFGGNTIPRSPQIVSTTNSTPTANPVVTDDEDDNAGDESFISAAQDIDPLTPTGSHAPAPQNIEVKRSSRVSKPPRAFWRVG
jgi:hypothetical protein